MKKTLFMLLATGLAITTGLKLKPSQGLRKYKDAAEKVTKIHSKSVVWVKYSIELPQQMQRMMPGQQLTYGVVLDDKGTIVASDLNNLTIARRFSNQQFQADLTPKNIIVEFDSGEEIKADYLTQDNEYSIFYLKPKEEDLESEDIKLHPLDLNKSAEAELGDIVISLAKMSPYHGSVPRAQLNVIDSVIKTPIKAFGSWLASRAFLPVFNTNAQLIGFSTIHNSPDAPAGTPRGFETIIVPAEDMKKIFNQAIGLIDEEPPDF